MYKILSIVGSVCLLFSCTNTKLQDTSIVKNIDSLALFSIVSPKETGISFVNKIKESMYMNGLTYEYLYNGSGLAVGDLNNDDLIDIFFVSSLSKNELYLNTGNLKFKNITRDAGVEGTYGFSTGVTMVDINSDGKLDIYVCKSGKFNDPNKRKNELFINKGNNENGIPVFKEEASKYNLDLPHQSTQAAFFDYDKDGDLDMFLLNHGTDPSYNAEPEKIPELLKKEASLQSDRLFRNDNGKFIDVSDSSGMLNNAISFGLGVAIGDLNNDSWSDVLVGQDYSEKDHLYINQQDGTFKEVIQKAVKHISNFSMGNDIADFNNDGLLDFITVDMVSESSYEIKTSMSGMSPERFYELTDYGLHHQYMFNTLQLNNGNFGTDNIPAFSDVAQLAGVSNTDWSWAPLFFDMDNDGYKDLFVSNGIKRDFRNNDYVKYKEKRIVRYIKDQKTTKDPKKLLEDYIKDLMSRIPTKNKNNLFFRNNGDLTFAKKNSNWNINALTSTTGAAYADFDNDGDLDVVTNNVDDFAFIYRNNTTELNVGNNFVQIQLKGQKNNPNGIGARVILEHDNNKQLIEQNLSRGFQSSVSKKIHFGVGISKTIEKLTVIWPDGKRQSLTDLAPNKTYTLDYKNIQNIQQNIELTLPFFTDITSKSNIKYRHQENEYDDFKRESLLPHRMSQFGPALAVADVNGDDLDDFYIGGALEFSGKLFTQNQDGTFQENENATVLWNSERKYEDTGAIFFDVDADGDQDLYVVSGGNEYKDNSLGLQDRLYINDGQGNFSKSNALPKLRASGGVVKTADYDNDGDLDLFIGGRQVPGKYPYPVTSTILRNDLQNGKLVFTNITPELAPGLYNIGMVTDANWVDIDNDKDLDLIVVGEWMAITILKNENGEYIKSPNTGLENHIGWWNTINSADFDNDGDIDFVVGNLGLNYKYKATEKEPFEIYTKDFDDNGTLDIVLGYYDGGNLVPLRGRQCTSQQVPIIKEKFPTYELFGKATLKEVYGEKNMKGALHYAATNFASSYLENNGDGTFQIHPLPNRAQLSSVNTILIDDFNDDGDLDILIAGNLYGSEVETPRNDASYGLLLTGNGKGNFEPVDMKTSGVCVPDDVKASASIKLTNAKKGILFAKNQGELQLLIQSK